MSSGHGCQLSDELKPYRTAIETLLGFGFIPSRTVLLAFGIDEESGGGRDVYYHPSSRLFPH